MFKTKNKTKPTDEVASDKATAAPKKEALPPKNRENRVKTKSAAGKSQRRMARSGLLLLTGLVGVSGGFLILHRSSSTISVYMATKGIPAGGAIVASALGVEQVPSPGISGALPLSQILNHNATVPILPGEVITKGLATSGAVSSSQAVVGISLTSGHMPSGGMTTGDQVELIYTGLQPLNNAAPTSSPTSSSINAMPGNVLGLGVISSVTTAPNGGNTLVDLIVSGKDVPIITTAAANNDVSLARRS